MSLLLSTSSWRLPAGMLLIRKSCRGWYPLLILTLLSAITIPVARGDPDVPAGFKADRYQKVWERNPFTLVTPAAPQVRATAFDKLVLVSWLNDGGKDVVFVQNTDTSEVQKVTSDPNANNLRLVEIHRNSDPQKAEVVLSNGPEQGSVKFRLDMPTVSSPVPVSQPPPGTATGTQGKIPGLVPGVAGQPGPGPPIPQLQMQPNPQQALQRARTAQVQQGAGPAQPENGTMPPRASEVRRKRITPPPSNEQPVGVPAPFQNPSNLSQPQ
jgi:hypothetical protein